MKATPTTADLNAATLTMSVNQLLTVADLMSKGYTLHSIKDNEVVLSDYQSGSRFIHFVHIDQNGNVADDVDTTPQHIIDEQIKMSNQD